MYNKLTLAGFVGQAPTIRTNTDGTQFGTFSLATSDVWTDKDNGELRERTEWHHCSINRDDLARFVERVHKGTLLLVEGKLTYRDDEQGGVKRTFANVRVFTYRVLRDPAEAGAGDEHDDQAEEAAE